MRIEGPVETVTDADADAYFASRHRDSRLGAWASDQSRPLDSRATFERRFAWYQAKVDGGEVPRPPHWTGFCVKPMRIEFWEDRPFRLHDRRVSSRAGNGWTTEHLYP